MNKLIFGKGTTDKIVNISYDDNVLYVYTANGEETICTTQKYIPYALTNEYYQDATKLDGPGYYKFVTPITETDYEDVRGRGIYRPRSIEEGYMLQSGETYFKGLKVDEVSLLSFDIEATTLDPKDKYAKVLMISNTYRNRAGQTTKRFFDLLNYKTERNMILDWCKWVREVDPDIILGHNIFGYDLPYLAAKCELPLGRNSGNVTFNKKPSKKRKDGQQQYDYYNATVNGRDFIDTMFLSLTYDVARTFPSYGLKKIEKHLNLVDDNRIEWDFDSYKPKDVYEAAVKGDTSIWQSFAQYCKDDADSPIKMFDIMAPSFFYLNRSIPKKFQQIINEATGSQIDSFMIRSYLQDGLALPMSSNSVGFEGAISMGVPGVYDNVRKVDVASLYPSIMREYKIYPKDKDYNKNFLKAIDYFTEERLKNKKLAKKTGNAYYDGLQSAQKIVINSMYGFMGANYLLFNFPEGAASVTRHGREILQTGVQWATGHKLEPYIEKIVNKGKENEKTIWKHQLGEKISEGKGYTLVNVDTDSFSYTNGIKPTIEEFQQEIDELNNLYPSLIRWEEDGIFDKIIVVKAKNYVMLSEGKVKYKGSSIKDQKKEPALRKLLNECFDSMLSEKDNIKELYELYCRKALNIDNINDWVVKRTVTKSVLNETTPGQANINAALKGRKFSEGDKIWLYVGEDPENPGNVNKKTYHLIEDFSGEYHKWHYVKRVYDTIRILENLIDIKQFKKYHNKTNRSILEG